MMALPALPKLPGLPEPWKERRKKKPEKLAYAVERRKRERVTIDELAERGADILRERAPELPRMDRRSAFTKVLDILDIPRNVVANVIGSLTGVEKGKLRKGTVLPKVYLSDVLGKLGVPKGPARSVLGFVGDVAADPLTWYTFGATTGLKIARHLPAILKPAVKGIRAAAKTGKAAPELGAALGIAKSLPLRRAALVRKLGEKGATKVLMGRRGGMLTRKLAREATKGRPEALAYLLKYGEKGRSLFRFPGMAKGWPILRVGKRARLAKAVQEGLAPTGQAAFKRAAQLRGRIARVGAVGKAAAASIGARKQRIAAELAKLKQKYAVTPEADALLTRRLQKAAVRKAGPALAPAGLRTKGAKEALKRVKPVFRRAQSEQARFLGSAEAPPAVRELMAVKYGAPYVPGKPGAIAKLQELKRTLFGPGASDVHQQMVAIEQAHGPGAFALGARGGAAMQKEAAPIIARIAKATGQKPQEISRQIFGLAEAGPGLAGLPSHVQASPIHKLIAAAKQAGLVDDPATKQFLQRHAGLQEAMQAAETAKKVPVGRQPGYVRHVATPKARPHIAMQERRIASPRPHPGPRLSALRPPSLGRRQLVRVQMPGEGALRETLSDSKYLGELTAKGGKVVSRHPIAAAQWNDPAFQQKVLPKLMGPPQPNVKPFAGPLFEEDIAKAYASRVSQHEQAMAAATMRDLVEPFGVDIPKKFAQSPRYTHLATVKTPDPSNPFYVLTKTGLYDRAYPRQVAEMIDNMTHVWDQPEMIEKLMSASDRVLGIWKSFQLFHPAYVIRNVFQNFFGGLMAGADPAQVSRLVFDPGTRALRKALVAADPSQLAGQAMRLGGRPVRLDYLYGFGRRFHGAQAGRAAQEIPATFGGPTGQMVGATRRGARGVYQSVFRANTWVEDHQRIATWLHFVDTGMDPEAAFMRTLLAMPDLSDLTHWERVGAARLFPWFRWMRRNGALQLFHYLPNKPAYMASMSRLPNFVEGFRGKDNVPTELRPMWMDEQLAMQVGGDKAGGTMFLGQTWFPFEEAGLAMAAPIAPGEAARRVVSQMRPGAKFLAEAATGRSVFKQAPLEPLRAGAIPAAFAGRSGTALDSLLALRPIREWAPGVGRVAQMPTAGRKASRAVLGGAMQPIDYQRGLEARFYELDRQQREIRAQYNRALQVGDQGLAESLYRQLLAIMRQMYQWKMPIARRMEQTMAEAGVPRPGPP